MEKSYAILYLNAIRVKAKQERKSRVKSVYEVNFEGKKEVLGLWLAENDGAKFWMGVLNELWNRGPEDILIPCTDGLSGFSDAVRAVFPATRVQRCMRTKVHVRLLRDRG